jgi:hypothetical protein
MADEIKIPVKTTLDPKGFRDLENEARRAQQAQNRRAQQERNKRTSLKDQFGDAFGRSMLASKALDDVTGYLKDFTIQSFEAANAAERLGAATDTLGRRYGTTGDAIVQSIQKTSNYTINQMNAMQAANQAMLLGVAKSPDEFERMTKIAVSLGRAMGQDATKSLEDFTIGVGRQSKLILDNLGIMINVEKANEKYAASIGKTADELTDAEKKQAFLNEALEQGEKKIAGMNTALTQADKVERLTARWADFQIEFGQAMQSIGDGSGALDLLNDGLDALIKGAQSWQTIGDNADKLNLGMEKLNKGTETWLGSLEQIPIIGSTIQGLDMWGSMIFRSDELKKSMTEAGQEIDAAKQAAEAAAGAAAGNAEAMEEEGESAEDLADKLERANAARQNAARRLLEINEEAAERTQETWEDYFEAEKEAWADYGKDVADIQKDSAKQQQEIQKELARSLADIDKKLTKDLSHLDRDLARDKAKARKDAAKDIRRSEEDSSRKERQERRQRQIDAKSDERLFQFEMRQLAAEGEFNRILEEKERRAIEQQIGGERQAEKDRAAEEDKQVEEQRAQEDLEEELAQMEEEAQFRREELQRQAEEDRALAEEQAAQEELKRQEELAQTLADEQVSYQERLEALRQHREERLAEIEAGKQEAIKKLAEQLTESKDLTERELKALTPVAGELGEDVGRSFAEGLNSGFERNQRIDQMLDGMGGRGGGSGRGGRRPPGMGRTRRGFATGGEFTVGGAGGTDSQLVQFMATPGERVTVQPQGQAGGPVVNININAQGPGMKEFAAFMERKASEAINEFHETILAPWTRGE